MRCSSSHCASRRAQRNGWLWYKGQRPNVVVERVRSLNGQCLLPISSIDFGLITIGENDARIGLLHASRSCRAKCNALHCIWCASHARNGVISHHSRSRATSALHLPARPEMLPYLPSALLRRAPLLLYLASASALPGTGLGGMSHALLKSAKPATRSDHARGLRRAQRNGTTPAIRPRIPLHKTIAIIGCGVPSAKRP